MSVSTDYSISLSNNKQKDIFQLAIEAAPNAMIVVDLAGKIVIANTQTEHMFGYSKDELIGNSIEMLLPPKSRDKHKHLREGFFKEQQARSMGEGRDLFGLRKDGGEVPLEIGLNPLHTTEQHLVLASVIDITERKRTEAKFIQVQKMESLGILAGGIAHDFNNLLTSILGYADLAMRDLPLASSSREYINQVIRGSHSAADLVKQLLAYSGKGFYEMQPIQLADIIEEIGHLLQVSISKKCVLQYRFEPGLPPIDADIAQIKQLAMNLIINASDAIGDRSGVIVISTGVMHCDKEYLSRTFNDGNTPEGLYVYMEISDTGCGMTAETIARIFDPFFTTKTVGRGLGLAAVQGIVRGHHGVIKVYSEKEKGTTFKILFPPSKQAAQHTASFEDNTSHDRWQGKGLVMVVDDEETIRSIAKLMLEKMGFTVITAEDGRAAIKLYGQLSKEISLILLDMTMPHMNGEETFRELRKINEQVQVLLTSGYSEQSALAKFTGKGLAGFMQKPYQYNSLRNKIRSLKAFQAS